MLYIILMCISQFFFLLRILLVVYFIFILTMEITLDKKQIQVISLFELKIDCKAMETTHNINNAFGPGTVNEHTLQRWLKKFCKGGKSLDGEEHSGWLSEVDDAQFRGSSKLILLQLHKKLPKNSTSTSLQLFGIWSKLERWKSSRSRYLMSWPQKKKKKSFWSVIFSYSSQ